jgi:hypothetical protein
MTAPADAANADAASTPASDRTGCYVYGILPGDVELNPDITGIGDPPRPVTLVHNGDLAAMVSTVDLGRPLGRPEELTRHEELLDATAAADIPVLPMRFGAVVSDEKALTDQLLGTYHDIFAAALKELEGRAEYIIDGEYIQEAILTELLTENAEAARLNEQIKDMPEQQAHDLRIRLGETINKAIEAKRDADTATLIDAISPLAVATAVRPPNDEWGMPHVAVLLELAREAELEQAVEQVGRRWEQRGRMRLRGPLAVYDFLMTHRPLG